ncbi:MAG TPA: polyphosphate kinase 2 family protein, partial [Thermoanaerobaculia bacterium]
EDALEKTSTEWAPWTIVPADKKWFRNFVVAKTIVETMENFNMKYPQPDLTSETIE